MEFERLDAVAVAAAVRAGELSPVETVESALRAIEALDGELNAFTVTLPERALARARELEKQLVRGEDPGPLAGVPISVKDTLWLAGAPATDGSFARERFVPDEDVVPVARVLAAGSVVVGKTNNPEFCFRGYTENLLWGATRNPWDTGRTPGGSSGGAGASVAARLTPLALGTDGGGSIRLPAAFCGIVGHKPTFGLVPKEPGFEGWRTLSVIGPLARSVRDAALVLDVVAGMHPADDLSYPAREGFLRAATEGRDLRGLRVAWSADLGFMPLEPDVHRVFAAAVARFAETGAELVEAHPQTAGPNELWGSIASAEGEAGAGALLAEWSSRMSPGIADTLRAGVGRSAHDYMQAQYERNRFARVWGEFFERHDLLLCPTVPLTAFPVGTEGPAEIAGTPLDVPREEWCDLTVAANLTGQPAVSVPMGFGDDGLPLGLQIVGRRFEDALVLAAAAAWERLAPWADLAPPLAASAA